MVSVRSLLKDWKTYSFEDKAKVLSLYLIGVETKIERHDYLTKRAVRKDVEIVKNLLIKLNEETRSTEINGFKLQLKYRRALIGIARIELFLWGVLNNSKDDICKEHKDWMMEKNIHRMNKDEILASIWELEQSESGFVFVLQERGAKVPKKPKETVQTESSNFQAIQRKKEEYMILNQKIECLFIEMKKLAEPFRECKPRYTFDGYRQKAETILELLLIKLEAFGA